MLRITGVALRPGQDESLLPRLAEKKARLKAGDILSFAIVKKSVDARKKEDVHLVYSLDVSVRDENQALKRCDRTACSPAPPAPAPAAPPVIRKMPESRPAVAGLGPAGLFAALILARAGLRPLVLERGQAVGDRRGTVERFHTAGELDPECNIQFGEGGAGAFSDGKLTTGIKDPRCRFVLETFRDHGAPEEILFLTRPHIGTDRLPGVIESIRKEIVSLGGEVRFSSRLSGIRTAGGRIKSVLIRGAEREEEFPCDMLLLAVGHSADDTQMMLFEAGMLMTQKPFSVGFRIEHPQEAINRAQYGGFASWDALPPAEYHLSAHLKSGRGVYTFCMCPGGQVVGAASRPGGVCVNGMSPYLRDGENANAAVLADVRTDDFPDAYPLSGYLLQRIWEERAFRLGGGDYRAPAMKAGDFLAGRASKDLGSWVKPTCRPGVTPSDLREALPEWIVADLKEGLRVFGRQLKGFDHPEAVLTGVEARSSCPVRHVRRQGGESSIGGVWTAGEGAGCAGGIMSAAVDGIRCAEDMLKACADGGYL